MKGEREREMVDAKVLFLGENMEYLWLKSQLVRFRDIMIPFKKLFVRCYSIRTNV